ncbi:TPA: hypothetical protein HA361_02000 [Candidatus Woesearchaeota archaeon]|nr:hypothetical protein [Candidatus Woesearchaeota archaeon]
MEKFINNHYPLQDSESMAEKESLTVTLSLSGTILKRALFICRMLNTKVDEWLRIVVADIILQENSRLSKVADSWYVEERIDDLQYKALTGNPPVTSLRYKRTAKEDAARKYLEDAAENLQKMHRPV